MTTGHVADIDFHAYLPHEAQYPQGEVIKTNASEIYRHGETISEKYETANATWGSLSGTVKKMPYRETFLQSFSNNCGGFSKATKTTLGKIRDALNTFGDGVTTFKTGTYDPLKKEVEAFNALPQPKIPEPGATIGSPTSRAWYPGGYTGTGPLLGTPHRTESARSAIVTKLINAKTAFEKLESSCATAIGVGAPAIPGTKPFGKLPGVRGARDAVSNWKATKAWLERINKVGVFEGRFAIEWAHNVKVAGDLSVDEIAKGATLIDKYGNKIPGVNLSFAGGVLEDGKLTYSGLATTGPKLPDWIARQVQADKFSAKSILESDAYKTADKWVGRAGKVLDFADKAYTYYDNYNVEYNKAVAAGVPPSEAWKDAAVSSAIVGTGENIGKMVGAHVGRTAGAALGQAIIPIPGVGAAVGGFVGGMVGEQVGGTIGKEVGTFVNDWRREGWDGAVGNVKEKASTAWNDTVDKFQNAGEAVKNWAADKVKKFWGFKT